jgi:polyisoprenoid-binding protein YceI
MQLNNLLPALSLAIVSLIAVPGSAAAAQVYVTDQGHTEVLFGWNHSGVSRQHAEFTVTKGTLNLADDIEKSSIDVNIDASSVSTGFAALDKHLKSKDFLEVETYPEIIFKSTSIKKTGEKTFDVTGNLTMHGVTKPVVLKAEMTHRGKHPVAAFIDYYKGDWIAFRATTEIDHMAFKVGSFSTGPIAIEINTEMKAR